MVLDAHRQVTGTAGEYQVTALSGWATLNIGGSTATTVSFVVGLTTRPSPVAGCWRGAARAVVARDRRRSPAVAGQWGVTLAELHTSASETRIHARSASTRRRQSSSARSGHRCASGSWNSWQPVTSPSRELRAAIDIEAASLSQQLAVLRLAGLVTKRHDKGDVIYSLSLPAVEQLLAAARRSSRPTPRDAGDSSTISPVRRPPREHVI